MTIFLIIIIASSICGCVLLSLTVCYYYHYTSENSHNSTATKATISPLRALIEANASVVNITLFSFSRPYSTKILKCLKLSILIPKTFGFCWLLNQVIEIQFRGIFTQKKLDRRTEILPTDRKLFYCLLVLLSYQSTCYCLVNTCFGMLKKKEVVSILVFWILLLSLAKTIDEFEGKNNMIILNTN